MKNGIEYNVSRNSSSKNVAYAYSLSAGFIWLAEFNTNRVPGRCKIRDKISFLMKEGV